MEEIDPTQYEQQLQQKLDTLGRKFAHLQLPVPEVYRSAPQHFRMRAEFRIWHVGDESFYAMTPKGKSKPQPIADFPIGSTRIRELMPPLLEAINRNEPLRRKLYAAEFLTTLSGDALITLIYHKPLDEHWIETATGVQRALSTPIIGRSRKQKVVLERDYVTEVLNVNGRRYCYRQVETGFTQPNAGVNEKMLTWALANSANLGGDLLELYCGNGNFTVVLAQNFNKVLATEIAKISVSSAQQNLAANRVDNVKIVRMSSEDFTLALNKVRPFRRLKDIELDRYDFSTVFVDPPRSGLDDETVELVRGFANILYISCNPHTLRTNVETLSATHEITDFAVFDQFPYTDHLECGALLKRR